MMGALRRPKVLCKLVKAWGGISDRTWASHWSPVDSLVVNEKNRAGIGYKWF